MKTSKEMASFISIENHCDIQLLYKGRQPLLFLYNRYINIDCETENSLKKLPFREAQFIINICTYVGEAVVFHV